ncbi:MAG TPA: VOC family protein [Candidatus Dormibacteraeota bacterium]|nr:VOC family protein [Candidatus Dormibacteraeota bacterium]
MADQSQFEQLDQIVDAILVRRAAALPDDNAELAAVVRTVAALRGLPSENFRAQLKTDLERRMNMASTAVKPVREGFHTITQYLIVSDSNRLIEFLGDVFGATEKFRAQRPGSSAIMHAEVQIGDSMIEMADANENFPPRPAAQHIYVDDVDAAYARALAKGAKSIQPPTDQEYGERGASIVDEFGNHWYIATPLKGETIPEGLRTVTPYLALENTGRFIQFLKEAFGAQEKLVVPAPGGGTAHAKIAIGDSILEMSDAHGVYKPMPWGLHLYVPDTDAVYEQALRAGAKSLTAPADQPYGDRSAGVVDPFGNQWFIATHIKDVAF